MNIAPTPRAADGSAEPFVLRVARQPAARWRVVGWSGREASSQLFRFDIEVIAASGDGAQPHAEVIGQPAWLELCSDGQHGRVIQGLISSVRAGAIGTLNQQSFRLRLVPEMWRMRKRINSRIFQEMNLLRIVHALLDEHQVPHRFALKRQEWPTRSYCVQYQESDYAFVRRLLAEEGVSFFFQQPHSEIHAPSPERTVLVMTDHNELAPTIGAPSALRFRPLSAGIPPAEEHMLSFSAHSRLESHKLSLTDYDFQRPLAKLSANVEAAKLSGAVELEVYDHRGEYQEVAVDDAVAAQKLEQVRRRSALASGTTVCRRMAVGHRFTLNEHESPWFNGDYVIARVEHLATPSLEAELRYQAEIECVPLAVNLRPPRVRPELHQVMETATVIGPADKEVHTDAYGRVLVRFHWDRRVPDDHMSCWLRVAQGWAGAGFGLQLVPRIGMEVLVSFIAGDLDRPVVVGCLSNPANPVPFKLPEGAAISGLRTRSTPAGHGYNELSFDDRRGAEAITLRAERDLNESIGRDRTSGIGGDRRVTIKGDDALMVMGSRTVSAAGASRDEIDGDAVRTVRGNARDRIRGRLEIEVDERCQGKIGGAHIHSVGGDASLSVTGHTVVSLGCSEACETALQATGTATIGSATNLRLTAGTSIELHCGGSSLVLREDGISIVADKVELKGREGLCAVGPGPALLLEDEAKLVAKVVRIFAKDSRLELEQDAKLKGKRVLINCDENTLGVTDEDAEAKTKPFRLQLTDYEENPYANKHYRMSVGGKVLEGNTTSDGRVTADIPEDAAVAQITLWIDEYPEGRARLYTIELLGPLPPATTNRGAKQRLKNLGYYAGEVDDARAGLEPALRWFQKDRELAPSGALDGTTAGALTEAAGG